ncbi:MFS transporter [Companilactobacillus futsaii]|uniref:MFS transporter n=1 Tax=Companilactobacillus futsaii TaxID=938155 RepID=UPI00189F279C|nr:MFS transporter [Companilactobacillus futsaii]
MNNIKQMSKFRKILLVISLMALNIVEQAGGIISGEIPAMSKSFHGISITSVELIMTVVSITITIFVLTSGFISEKIGQKQTAVLGLAIAAIFSIVPAWTENFSIVLGSRIILGIGIGLANPLAISLIGEFFTGDTLATLMGWRSAIAGIGVAAMTFLSGQLLNISWHASYYSYLLFVPVLIMFILFVPQPEKHGLKNEKKESTQESKSTKEIDPHARLKVIGYAAILFFYLSLGMIGSVKLSLLYVEQGIGTATQASNALSLGGLVQLVGGALFGLAYKHFKRAILPVGIVLSGLGIAGIAFANSSSMVLFLLVISSIVGGMSIPYIFNKVSDYSTTETAPLNNGIVLVGSNLGSFFAPYIAAIFGSSAQSAFLGGGVTMTVLGFIITMIFLVGKKQAKK